MTKPVFKLKRKTYTIKKGNVTRTYYFSLPADLRNQKVNYYYNKK